MAGTRFTHSNNILSVFRARMSFGARSPQDSAVRRGRRAERLHGKTVPPVTMASVARGNLEPLAEVEGALLVVEVLHLPHPKLLGLLRGGEHFSAQSRHRHGQDQPQSCQLRPASNATQQTIRQGHAAYTAQDAEARRRRCTLPLPRVAHA